jgi:hypothetical protein
VPPHTKVKVRHININSWGGFRKVSGAKATNSKKNKLY